MLREKQHCLSHPVLPCLHTPDPSCTTDCRIFQLSSFSSLTFNTILIPEQTFRLHSIRRGVSQLSGYWEEALLLHTLQAPPSFN